jgi:high-affinity Fe2+/Pb2+ permease
MTRRIKALVCYLAALVYTFGGIWLLKAVFGDAFKGLPLWMAAGLYVLFVLPLVALVAYGYSQSLKAPPKA